MRLPIIFTNKAFTSWFAFALLVATVSLSVGSIVTAKPVDTVKPRVTLVVSKTLVTKAETLKLVAQASDNVGITQLIFFDGATKLYVDSSAPYQFDFKMSNAQNGVHRFSAQAFDSAKNQAVSPVVTVQVKIPDSVKPKVNLNVSKTRVLTGEKFLLTVQAWDNVGVTHVQFYDGSTMVLKDSTAPYSFETSILAGASKTFSARAFDAALNMGISDRVSVLVDDTRVTQFGTTNRDYASGVAVDATGNVYVLGSTIGTFPGNSNVGDNDVFVTKFDPNYKQLWVKQHGTKNGDYASGVAVDATGNVYITGITEGAFPGSSNMGDNDAFVMKFDTNGTQLWVKQFGTNGSDSASGVAIDATGNVVISGETNGAFSGYSNAGENDTFVLKLDPNGTQQWVKQLGTKGSDTGNGVAVDGNGNIIITGFTGGSFSGNRNAGDNDVFVTKLDTSGTQQWVKQLGTKYTERAFGVAVDATSNVYITGITTGAFSGNRNAGDNDVFVTKLDTSGTQQWVKQLGTQDGDFATGIAVDTTNNVFITGFTRNTFPGNSNAGDHDVIVMKFDTNGTQQWVKQLGTQMGDFAYGVTVDATGNVYAMGHTWGAFPGNSNSGDNDIIVMNFDASGASR